MIDTSGIDIKAVIDQLSCIDWSKPVKSHGETVYKGGPCPFCHQGKDRFAVFVEGEKPHFYCGIHGTGCGKQGDVISFVKQLRGYSSSGPAIRDLREMGYPLGDENVSCYRPPSEREKPPKLWQDQGNAIIHAAQKYLWSSVGKQTLDYLRKRGLTDETMKRFCLGYWPKWTEYALVSWGLEGEGTFWIRPGILIPWYEGNALWKINQRLTEYTPKEHGLLAQGKSLPRYKQVRGGSNGLFHVDAIEPGKPVVVTEGEFCAMTLVQETDCVAVATGSTKGARVSRWIAELSLASPILVAFDNDQCKGEDAASYWLELFEDKASLWLPWSKDVNDMHQEGMSVSTWLAMGISLALSPPIAELSHPSEQAVSKTCCICGAEVEFYSEQGIAFCSTHWQEPGQASEKPIETLSLQERQEQFDLTVKRIASVFPGGCRVTPLPLGTTLAQWLAQWPFHHKPYIPCLLPALPRRECPAKCLDTRRVAVPHTKQTYIDPRLVPCKQRPLANGWCEEHQLAQAMLDLGAMISYPRVQLNPHLCLPAGKASWEEHVVCRRKAYLAQDIKLVRLRVEQQAMRDPLTAG
jgi:hypothetical protein